MLVMFVTLGLLTLTAFMYIDILGARVEVREQLDKVERLRQKVETRLQETSAKEQL